MFEANTAEQAVHQFSSEAARAEELRRAIDAGSGFPESMGEQVIPDAVLNDIRAAAADFENAMKTALGHYTTAMYREKSQGAQHQLQANGHPHNGWQGQPTYR